MLLSEHTSFASLQPTTLLSFAATAAAAEISEQGNHMSKRIRQRHVVSLQPLAEHLGCVTGLHQVFADSTICLEKHASVATCSACENGAFHGVRLSFKRKR